MFACEPLQEDGSGGDEGFRARVEAIRGRPDEQEGGGQRDAQRGRKGEPLIRKEQPKDIADSGQDPGPMKNDPGGGGRNEEQGGGGGEREGYGRAREASANKRGAGETPGVAEDLDAARVAKKVRAQPGSAQNATAAAPSGRSSPQDGREVQGGEAEGGKNASGASQGGSAVVGGGAGRPEREPNATRPARQPNARTSHHPVSNCLLATAMLLERMVCLERIKRCRLTLISPCLVSCRMNVNSPCLNSPCLNFP